MAGLAIAVALWQLSLPMRGLAIDRLMAGSTPVTVFRPASGTRAPVVIIGHGFAGSQQLMLPFALTLARNGYTAVTYDALGHGRNAAPLRGSITDENGATRALVEQLAEVAAFARALPTGDGRLAVLGHSMSADIVVRYAMAHPEVAATVAVSTFSPTVTATSPRNLLVIVGALEPAMLQNEGRRLVGMASGGGQPEAGRTYGSFDDGSARRLAFAAGVEHIGVLYSRQSMAEALAWLNAAFGRAGSGDLDRRGIWLALLFSGIVLLARPLATLLPRVADRPLGAALAWPRLLAVVVLPAIATPLLLWRLPTGFLPILLGDYLAVHFAVYGLLTTVGLALAGGLPGRGSAGARVKLGRFASAAAALAAYSIFAIGLPLDRFVISFMPTTARLGLLPILFAGLLVFFAADEWLIRGRDGAPGGRAIVTKLCFLLSLALAIALSPERLFFLIIVSPIILVFFIVYGLLSGWAYRRTWHPLVGAIANALAFAWAIAVTFPILGGAS